MICAVVLLIAGTVPNWKTSICLINPREKLRAEGLKIGSTTGYTREMMDVVQPAAEAKGYRVDYCATPNLLPVGRPAPYMVFENLTKLGVPCLDTVVKVGDTIADIKEGVNAKVWSVGIVLVVIQYIRIKCPICTNPLSSTQRTVAKLVKKERNNNLSYHGSNSCVIRKPSAICRS